MIKSNSDWWYARVGASPRPEAGELVNIGLIIGNGEAMDVEAASDLPRLQGLVAPSERLVYEEMLESLKSSIHGGTDLQTLRQTYGPQIKISKPRKLFSKPDQDLRVALRRKLLETPSEPKTSLPGPREEAEEKLEHMLNRVVQLGYDVEKRPTPAKLYKDKWHEVFGRSSPGSLAYALRSKSQKEDVLLDGVVVQREDPDYSVTHGQVSRIGRVFWEYRQSEEKILQVVGRSIRAVGFIFNGDELEGGSESVVKAKRFIRHTWERDVDRIIEAHDDRAVDDLREVLDTGDWG